MGLRERGCENVNWNELGQDHIQWQGLLLGCSIFRFYNQELCKTYLILKKC